MSERLTDERIRYIIDVNAMAFVEPEGLAMAREIQERRAADLTLDEAKALVSARKYIAAYMSDWDDVIAALDKVTGAHGAKP